MPTMTEVSKMLFRLPDEDYNAVAKYIIFLSAYAGLLTENSDLFYSKENQDHLNKAVKQLRDGKGTPHELIEETDYGKDMVR